MSRDTNLRCERDWHGSEEPSISLYASFIHNHDVWIFALHSLSEKILLTQLKDQANLPSLASPAIMHAADFVLPPSIMKQDDLSSQGRRWIRPNRREIRPPETPVADFKSVAEIPCPTACYVMGYVEESERIPNIWCCTRDKLLFRRIPLTPNEVHIPLQISLPDCRRVSLVL